jgi:hypothetical protein
MGRLPAALCWGRSLQSFFRVGKLTRWTCSRGPTGVHLGKIGQPPPGQERAVYWGDWFAVRFWFACCVLLWLLLVADFLFGGGGR